MGNWKWFHEASRVWDASFFYVVVGEEGEDGSEENGSGVDCAYC